MSHFSAFIITSFTKQDMNLNPELTPGQAAREAGLAATALADAMSHADGDEPRPETLSVSGNQHRFIQGEQRTNAELFGKDNLSERTPFQFWSDNKGRYADPGEVPQGTVDNAWNTASELVTLALKSSYGKRPIFPQALLEPDGTFTHHLTFPDTDVFGDTAPGGTAALYLDEPASAWFSAQNPLREINQANFRADYVRKLHQWKGPHRHRTGLEHVTSPAGELSHDHSQERPKASPRRTDHLRRLQHQLGSPRSCGRSTMASFLPEH